MLFRSDRLERLPWIPKPHEFSRVLEKVNTSTLTGLRNWLVVRLLAETGASLAELCRLRWENCEGRMLSLEEEKKPRKIRLSEETALRMEEWRKKNPGKHVFPGFNRHGITSEKMTPRGVELFFRFLAKSSGYRLLKPKTLRHYCIVDWLRSGIAEKEVLQRLGVHPNYSLALYRKVLEREQNL